MPKVILSTNDNNHDMFLLPIVTWLWKRFGFETVLLMPEKEYNMDRVNLAIKTSMPNIDTTFFMLPIDGIPDGCLASLARLYAASLPLHPEDYLVTSDIDMVPLCNMLYVDYKTNPDKVNLYGHDLTEYKKYPVCYVGAKVRKWRELMEINEGDINYFIRFNHIAGANEKATDVLTRKLLKYGVANCNHNDRGKPLGRVDRDSWDEGMKSPFKVDAHLFQKAYEPEKFEKIIKLIAERFPDDDLIWLVKYMDEYTKLL